MLINTLAQTYARAICQIAEEKNMIDQVETQVKMVEEIIASNEDFKNLFYHPRVPAEAKKETVQAIFKDDVDQIVLNALLFLIDKRRETALSAIIKEYVELANEIRNIVTVEVTVARALTEEQKKALSDKLEKILCKTVSMKMKIDESIIGGVVVRLGDKLIDGSVNRQLRALKSTLLSDRLVAS